MRYQIPLMAFLLLFQFHSSAQDSLMIPEPRVVPLEDLVMEALARNPAILGSVEGIHVANAMERQMGVLDPPELNFRRKEMPGFRWSEEMATELELMQMVRFPSKYATERRIGALRAEHAHHESEEIVNTVLLELRRMYAELWYVQQRQVLEQENQRLTRRLGEIASARYRVGKASRNDMLMAEVLRTASANSVIEMRQLELGLKARISGILDRHTKDTIGFAVVSEDPALDVPLDTLLAWTQVTRPMLVHDSLRIAEQEELLTSARQEYLPDFRFGVGYMDSEMEMFRGWTVSAGITLPFVPWSLGKAGAGVEAATHERNRGRESYASTRNMVFSEVRAAYEEVTGQLQRMRNIGGSMLPAAEQALRSSLSLYQDGEIDYPMVHQAYTAFLDAQTDYFMTRMDFEKSIARLRFATGFNGEFQQNR